MGTPHTDRWHSQQGLELMKTLSASQVSWAQGHDWFIRALPVLDMMAHDDRFKVVVADIASGANLAGSKPVQLELTFYNFKLLQEWAGY